MNNIELSDWERYYLARLVCADFQKHFSAIVDLSRIMPYDVSKDENEIALKRLRDLARKLDKNCSLGINGGRG